MRAWLLPKCKQAHLIVKEQVFNKAQSDYFVGITVGGQRHFGAAI